MKNIIERIAGGAKIARYLPKAVSTRLAAAALAALAAGGAWAAAPTPVAEWNGDLANGSTKGKYTMSVDSGDSSVVSFANGNAVLTSSTSVSSKGVQIAWPDPTSDNASFTNKKMSVVLQYSGLSIPSGNTSLLSALWGGTSKEYMVRTTSNNGTAAIATDITGASSAGNQYAPSSNFPAPEQGKLLVCFSGDSSHLPGIDLYFSTYDSTTATYGDYQRVHYWSAQKVDNGTFYGLKIGGTIANTGKYYRPGMTVEAVQIYDTVVSASSAAISANTSWSSLVWDYERPDFFHAANYTYQVNVTDNATLDLGSEAITAGGIVFNIDSGKRLTITGSATISGAAMYVIGGGKLVLNYDPGCNIVVASGATLDISASTVSSAITNNGTVNANGCAFTGAVSNSGTLNTSGTVSFSSSASNTSSGTFNVVSGTTTYNSSSQKGISGTLNIAKNATLINGKQDSIPWDGTVHVHIHGIVTMDAKWTIGANNYIHLYDGALVNGSASNAFHFNQNSGEGKIIAETGSSTITAPFVKGYGTIAKSGSGTLRLENQRLPSIGGSEGTIEVVSTESHVDSKHSHTDSNIPFSGTVKFITSSSPSGQYHMLLWSNSATAGMFANRPALDVSGEVRLYDKIATYPLVVRNLCGTGTVRMGGGTSVSGYRYIDTSQTANTVFDGMFTTISTHAAYDSALTVRGAEDATEVHSLTLSGDNTTTGPLVVEANAKVIFSSTGKWSGGTVTVKSGGVLESQNSESIADLLVVQEGATLKFANGVPLAATEYDWSGVSNDQSVNVDLSGIAPSATPVTLIASDVTIDAAKFKVSASQRTATLSVENGVLKATFANFWTDGEWGAAPVANDSATLVLSQNSTLSVSEALTLGDITVENTSGGEVTLTVSGAGALTTGGWTIPSGVTVNTSDGMSISGTVAGGGIINVPANTTLTMDGVTTSGDTLADRVKVAVFGTLKTKGLTTLSAANTSAAGSLIEVVAGTNTLSSAWQGIAGNITVDNEATLSFGDSLSGGVNYYYNHINPLGSSTIDVSGTIVLGSSRFLNFGADIAVVMHSGSSITGARTDYGSLGWTGNCSLTVDGDATISAPMRINTGVSPTFTIRNNATLTIDKAFISSDGNYGTSGGSITKAGAGTLDLTAITPTKPITIEAGTVVADVVPTAQVTINENGTFELKDCAWTSNVFSGSGTLYLHHTNTSTDRYNHSVSGSSFSGRLKIDTPSGKKAYFNDNPETQLTGRPELVLELGTQGEQGQLWVGGKAKDKYFKVKNLSGWGYVVPWSNAPGVHYFETVQNDNTEFSGVFADWNGSAIGTGEYKTGLTVKGGDTVKSLTLTAANTTTGPLLIQDNGKVVFYGAGAWAGNVTVGANGYLESTNPAAVTKLTLQDGANIVFPASSSTLSSISALTFASGTTKIHFGSGVTPTAGTLINWSAANLEAAPAGEFALADSTLAGEWILTKSAAGLSIAAAGAQIVYSNGDVAPYTTIDYETLMAYKTAIGTDEGATLRILDNTLIDTDTISYLATQDLYYDNVTKTISKAVAKVVTTTYPSLSAAISEGAAVTLLRESSEAITLDVAITLTETAAYSGTLSGSGTLTLSALRSSALSLGEWTGTVVLPQVNGTEDGFRFDYYGKSGSTIAITDGFYGWINTSTGDAYQIKAGIWIDNDSQVTIDGTNSGTWYQIAKLSGTGNFSLIQSNAPAGFHILVLEDYSGTLSNTIGSGTPTALTVSRLNLAAAPVAGQKLINTTTPNAVNLETVYVGDAQQSVTLAKGSDGIYVALVSVTKGDNPTTYYATVSDAMTAAGSDAATITLLGNTDSNVSLAVGQSLVTDGFSVGTVSTGAEHCHVVDNAGVYTVALDQFAVTIPSVANTAVSVSYTSGGVAQVATAAGDIMVDYGTDVTATWTAVSGYKITSGASQTLTAVASAQALTGPTVEEMSAVVSNVNFTYGADYTTAEVTATIAGEATSATLTYGSNTYNAQVSNGTVTFTDVVVSRDSGNIYAPVSYAITTDAHATTGGAGSAVAADTTAWFSQSSENLGEPVGGSWATAVNLSTPTNVTDNTFEATSPSTTSRVVLEFEVCFSSTSSDDVSGEAQAAIKLGEVDGATTFMVLTNGNEWAAVSAAGFVPNVSETYKVVLTIDYVSNTYKVDVEGHSMTNVAGAASFPLAANRSSVQNIDFAGSGTLTSMRGDQVEGYMVVDKNGKRYPSIAAAISAYTQDPSIGPLRVLHSGTPPSGWRIDGDTLIKAAKGLFFMAF